MGSSRGAGATALGGTNWFKDRVDRIARDSPRFKPLQTFLSLKNTTQSRIKTIDFPEDGRPLKSDDIRTMEEHGLSAAISETGISRRLFLIENLSPHAATILGDHLPIEPEFFLEFLDAIPPEFVISEKIKERISKMAVERQGIVSKPWYTFERIDGHLPMLSSIQPANNYITVRYVGPREYADAPDEDPPRRMEPDLNKMNIARVGGLHFPIEHDHNPQSKFENIAVIRHLTSVWFKPPTDPSEPEWTIGVILLDPPFEVAVDNGDPESVYGTRSKAAYRPFLDIPSQAHGGGAVDRCTSYLDCFVFYMLQNPALGTRQGYHPFTVIEGLARIIASEWITTCIYFERDLNSIEWRQELKNDSVDIHARFLNQLFTLRRRLSKFKHLLQDQSQLFGTGAPRAWMSPPARGSLPANVGNCLAGIQSDLEQALSLLEKTSARVSEAIELTVAGIQLREAEESTTLNGRLALVTMVATVFLPFGTVASILGMQTSYGPPQGGRWADFWMFSTVLLVIIWAVLGLCFRFGRSSRKLRAPGKVGTRGEVG